MSGIDVVDGTPVLDIKPYIASYDEPSLAYSVPLAPSLCDSYNKEGNSNAALAHTGKISSSPGTSYKHNFCDETCIREKCINLSQHDRVQSTAAEWISESPVKKLDVRFTLNAQTQLGNFSSSSPEPKYKLNYLQNAQDLQKVITDILEADPRSTYRRRNCDDKLYFFVVDKAHITSWFYDSRAEVLRVKSVDDVDIDNLKNAHDFAKINTKGK